MTTDKPTKPIRSKLSTILNKSPRINVITLAIVVFVVALTGSVILYLTYAAVPVCSGVSVPVGGDIQAAIDANPANTTICLAEGVYRGQSLRPKSGNIIVGSGQDKTYLNGSNLVSSFGQSGSLWYASNQTQELGAAGYCDPDYPACTEPVLLYVDDVPQVATTSLGAVSAGKYFFDHAANRVYFATNPSGHKVEVGAVRRALDGARPGSGPSQAGGAVNVTVRDLTIEKYAQQAQQGAIQTNDGWLVQNVTSQLNAGQGITLLGNNPRVTYSKFIRNGQIGVGANGGDGIDNDYGHAVYKVTVDNTEIAYNNNSHFNYGWEAGGTKFWATNGSVIRNNWVHHNIGPGLWADGFNDNITFDANLVEDNVQNGIFHEISLKATITNNLIQRNGGVHGSLGGGNAIQDSQGAISISSGKGVTIANNYIYNNGRGILLIDDPHYPDPTNNVIIRSNVIRQSGDQAIAASIPAYNAQGGNLSNYTIDYNHYTTNMAFGFNGAARSWNEWRSFGKDLNGDQKANDHAIITTAGIQPQSSNQTPDKTKWLAADFTTTGGTIVQKANGGRYWSGTANPVTNPPATNPLKVTVDTTSSTPGRYCFLGSVGTQTNASYTISVSPAQVSPVTRTAAYGGFTSCIELPASTSTRKLSVTINSGTLSIWNFEKK